MAVADKQRVVSKILAQLTRHLGSPIPEDLAVLEHLLVGVLQQDTSFGNAIEAYRRIKTAFFDFNELRVSHPRELEGLLEGIPNREEKSRRILQILQFIFETTYLFDLESMRRKPLKQAQKQLSKIAGTNEFAVAATVQRSLGGHAIPLDQRTCALLAKLGLANDGEDHEQIRSGLEHLVPKAKGVEFSLFLGELIGDPEKQRRVLSSVLPRGKRPARAGAAKLKLESESATNGAHRVGRARISSRANPGRRISRGKA